MVIIRGTGEKNREWEETSYPHPAGLRKIKRISFKDFLDLKDKGLEGDKLEMFICDGKRCIKNAFLFVYPKRDTEIVQSTMI